MKCSRVLRVAAAAGLAWTAAQATAADMANPTGFMYYGYGQGSFGYTGTGYTPSAAGNGVAPGAPGPDAGYAYGYTAPGYAPAASGAYPGYGYGGGNGGGYGGYGGRHCRRRAHCCSFGGNCDCCNNCWDSYCGPGCAEGAGCCGAPVKVHRRHRALGCGAGPCVDAACGTAPAGRRHLCHLRRRGGHACGPVEINYAIGGASGPATMYDNANTGWQPYPANPIGEEAIQPPSPSSELDDEPQPMPADDSST